ncbi:MAG: hypothetical protein HYV38_00835 [Candidatus Levybacteria bacterium]|nr:hypothetical protein [Candidatus Levybacteria bacterium]MBI2420615.1 hypothetical protein [Candidatus Levybacteria bacterium]MBI4098211.1 hypothetical protein [Candidatus Levybacteria bacterium]
MSPSILKTFREELLSLRSIILILSFFFAYLFLYTFISNNILFSYSVTNGYSIFYKLKLFSEFLIGLATALSTNDFILLLITSFLVGVNFVLLIKTLGRLKNQKVRLSVGGGTILGLVAAGCSTCGLSVLSILGITSASLQILPFMGIEFNILAIALLLFSAIYTLWKLSIVACEIRRR